DDGEPRLRIPVPAGWERNTMMDSQVIRYAIVAMDLVADGFATSAVVIATANHDFAIMSLTAQCPQ
ncbi:hypothetical protein C6A85_16690, partial [Mycobacterium sp. ITM-2017-0098]